MYGGHLLYDTVFPWISQKQQQGLAATLLDALVLKFVFNLGLSLIIKSSSF